MFKKIIIWFLELAIPVWAYVLPFTLIVDLLPPLGKNEGIVGIIGIIVGFVFFVIFRGFLQRRQIVPKIIDKLSNNKK